MIAKEVALSFDDYVKGIQSLTLEEQLDLIELISSNVKMTVKLEKKSSLSKLSNLKRHKLINGDPDELVNFKVWEWKEQQNL